jgi:hypothetical protein
MAEGPAGNSRTQPGAHAPPGTAVQVRSSFHGGWCDGFEVAEVVSTETGVSLRVRRRSDGSVLPALFPSDDVLVVR